MCCAILGAALEQELKAQADAQTGLALTDGLTKCLAQTGPPQLAHCIGKSPDAREDDFRRLAHALRVRGDLRRTADSLDRLLHTTQITHTVIENDDHVRRSRLLIRARQGTAGESARSVSEPSGFSFGSRFTGFDRIIPDDRSHDRPLPMVVFRQRLESVLATPWRRG